MDDWTSHPLRRSLVNDAILRKRSLSLMVLDIDTFSLFNGRHAHAAGDDVLRQRHPLPAPRAGLGYSTAAAPT